MTAPFDIRGTVTFDTAGATAALDKVTGATEKSAKAAKEAAPNYGQFGSSVSLAGAAVGKLNPALGGLVTMAGSSLGAIQALTTAGMGPLGVALAAVSLAMAAGAAVMNSFEQSARDAATGVTTLRTELLDAADAFDALVSARARDAAASARGARLALGQATVAESGLEIERLNRALDAQNLTNFRGENDRQIRQLEDRLQMVTEGEAAARAALAADEATAVAAGAAGHGGKAAETGRAHRGGGNNGAAARAARHDDEAKSEEAAAAAHNDALADQAQALEDRQLEILQKGLDERREAERIGRESITQNAIDDEERRVEGVRRAIDREVEAREKAASVAADIQSATMGAMNVVTSAIDASLEGSRKSEKEKTKIKAQAAIIESIIGAALSTAQAVAAYASFNIPQGIAHTAAAAMFVIAGVKAGAAAGGGGGGASAPATSGAGAGPISSADAGGGRGGDVYNINWGSSALVYAADREQLGDMLVDAIGASTSRRAA